jgi:hypothetical protein
MGNISLPASDPTSQYKLARLHWRLVLVALWHAVSVILLCLNIAGAYITQSLDAAPEKVRLVPAGRIVNLLSNDSKRVRFAAESSCALLTGPFEAIVILILAWEHVGVACLGMCYVTIHTFDVCLPVPASGAHFSLGKQPRDAATAAIIALRTAQLGLRCWPFSGHA